MYFIRLPDFAAIGKVHGLCVMKGQQKALTLASIDFLKNFEKSGIFENSSDSYD